MELSFEDLNLALEDLCQNFGGEWLLLGGSLVRLDIDQTRGTHDIDICRLDDSSIPEKTRFIEFMKAQGFSPEQMNSAVEYFLHQIPNWKNHLVFLKRGKRGVIYRPSLTLFSILKLKRGSSVDQNDVALALKKWGSSEFDKEYFLANCAEREVVLGKKINLPI